MKPLDLAALLLVTLVWGVNFAVGKAGVLAVPPIAFVALRFAAVALVMLPFLRWPPPRWRDLLVLSVVLGTAHFSLMFIGLAGIDISTASIAIQLQVPFAALLAAYFFAEKLGWRRLIGMAIAFAGVVLIAGEPRLGGNLLPLFLVISAACVWAYANILIKKLGDDVGVWPLNGWIALLALPQTALLSAALEDGQFAAIAAAGWELAAWVGYQALLVTVFGYGVWYACMRGYNVNQVMPFTLLVPVFGVLSGVVFFDDRLTLPMLIGGLGTILGVAIIVVRRPRVVAASTKAGL
jgi:O-acetylserine/cysteine efflux transporter